MASVVPRPCGPRDLVEIAPPYKGGWGPPLSFAPEPWPEAAAMLEFEDAGVIQADEDWDRYVFSGGASHALRYVLLFAARGWVLRFGRTVPGSTLKQGGSHRHMFSWSEQRYAEQQGQAIRSGYIYGISASEVTLG